MTLTYPINVRNVVVLEADPCQEIPISLASHLKEESWVILS